MYFVFCIFFLWKEEVHSGPSYIELRGALNILTILFNVHTQLVEYHCSHLTDRWAMLKFKRGRVTNPELTSGGAESHTWGMTLSSPIVATESSGSILPQWFQERPAFRCSHLCPRSVAHGPHRNTEEKAGYMSGCEHHTM